MKPKTIIIILAACLLASCGQNRRLEEALQSAGNNRQELEKVLDFYRYDEEKLAAARFLIENMPKYYSLHGVEIDTVKARLLKFKKDQVAPSEDEKAYWMGFDFERLEKVYDVKVVTADFLINNIERAFRAWKGRPWNKHLEFDDFCELILPYRIGNEPLKDWRKAYEERYGWVLDSLYTGNDVVKATNAVAHVLREEGFVYCWDYQFPHLGASFLLDHRVGMCIDACDLALYVYRALGIPIAMDLYAYSSETRKGHTWNAVRDTTGRFIGFWFSEQDAIRDSVYSDLRKAGKAFRQCFGSQRDQMKKIWSDPQVPDFFKNAYRKDVSEDYYQDTVRIPATTEDYGQYAYLGVFNPHGWIGIDMAEIKDGQAVFPNVERKVIYAPMSHRDGKYQVMDYPFYFDGKQNIPYRPDTMHKEKVRLLRKNPLFTWHCEWLNNMAGCCIEAGNDLQFKKVNYSFRVPDSLSIAYNIVQFPLGKLCRYLRFKAATEKDTELGEFWVYSEGKEVKTFRLGGSEPENINRIREKACDGNPLTRFHSLELGGQLTVDFGRAIRIDSLAFMPRNDDNFVRIGDEYELFYQDGINGWKSLGKKIATRPWLDYDNVPRGALLHLHCHTRGEEEQAFQMKDGKQFFVSNQDIPVRLPLVNCFRAK